MGWGDLGSGVLGLSPSDRAEGVGHRPPLPPSPDTEAPFSLPAGVLFFPGMCGIALRPASRRIRAHCLH